MAAASVAGAACADRRCCDGADGMIATDTITDATVTTPPPPCGWPSCDQPAAWIGRMRGPCRHTLLRCNRHYARAVALEALNHTYHHPPCPVRAEMPPVWRLL